MISRRYALVVMVVMVVFLLVGCGHNTSGRGNEFRINATVDHVGDHSVTVTDVVTLEAYGKAETWFHSGKHQIHDNYNNCSWHGRHYVGHLLDDQGLQVPLNDLGRGETVEIEGAIRQNASNCGKNEIWKWRPVFVTIARGK